MIGAKAASFALLNQLGQEVALHKQAGKWVLIYFYPKASTPGCTTQACGLRDIQGELLKQGVVTLGISPDPVAKLKKFHDSYHLNFDLLSDPDHQIAEAYGVWAPKKFMGKEFLGIVRTSFLINPTGDLVAVIDNFKTSNHHQKVLDIITEFA